MNGASISATRQSDFGGNVLVASVSNHFNQERHLYLCQIFKLNRTVALFERRSLCIGLEAAFGFARVDTFLPYWGVNVSVKSF